jgi:lysophospholipid hydrolase
MEQSSVGSLMTGLTETATSAVAAISSTPALHHNPVLQLDGAHQRSTLAATGSFLYTVLSFIPGLLLSLVSFTTITLPTFLFSFASMSLTFTMSATSLVLLLLAVVSTFSWLVRYRFLNMYARLPQEPQRKEPQIDLYPDTQEGDSKPGLANYLDEFLEAIKVRTRHLMAWMQLLTVIRSLVISNVLSSMSSRGPCKPGS